MKRPDIIPLIYDKTSKGDAGAGIGKFDFPEIKLISEQFYVSPSAN